MTVDHRTVRGLRPAEVETADPGNAAWYSRLGFDTEVEEPCFAGGPPQWFMRRRPQPAPHRPGGR